MVRYKQHYLAPQYIDIGYDLHTVKYTSQVRTGDGCGAVVKPSNVATCLLGRCDAGTNDEVAACPIEGGEVGARESEAAGKHGLVATATKSQSAGRSEPCTAKAFEQPGEFNTPV